MKRQEMLMEMIKDEIEHLQEGSQVVFRLPKVNFDDAETWPNQVWLNVVALSLSEDTEANKRAIKLATTLFTHLRAMESEDSPSRFEVFSKLLAYFQGEIVIP
jgi:hypothetical protein